MNASNCPQPEFLQQFLLGQLPIDEIERCQFHLSVCDPCVETIEMLKADDTFTGQVRAAFLEQSKPDDERANEEYVDQLIEQAGRWSRANPDSVEPATASQVSIDRAAEVFRLLAEPVGEGEIGRLAHYSIVKLIGSGSTGVVFLANDRRLDRRVVLKILRPSLGQPAQTRFIAEAKATAAIEHPNVVTIYEVGSDGPLSYIAMQWTPGETLDHRLQNAEPLPLPEVRRLVAEVARGLAAAHASGLIHRDIKPANIWITGKNGEAKILDFGLVRVADEDPQLTCTGMIAGTPCFMSPEQSRGDALDHRSDLFSLGCLLYQALTGRLPFHSHNALATLRSIQQDQPLAPAVLDPSIPTDVSDLTMCLLEKSPARRPPDAQSVAEALMSDQDQWKFLLPEPPTQSKPVRKRPGSFWKSIAALAAGALLGIGGFIYGQQIIRVVTNQGEIVIETDVDDVKIEVIENGEVVRIVDLATEQSIELRAGRYDIRPAGNDDSITLDKNSLTLTRGGQVVVKVTNNTTQSSIAGIATNEQRELAQPNQRVEPFGELAQIKENSLDEISRFELLQVEKDKLSFELQGAGESSMVEPLKRFVAVITEQFELLSDQINQLKSKGGEFDLDGVSAVQNPELLKVLTQRDAVRQELAASRRGLLATEEHFNLPPSQPIYDGQTYEQLLAIVRTERNMEKLIPAVKGIAALASEHEKPEMLEAVIQIARRVGIGANNDKDLLFQQFIHTLFGTLDFDEFTSMFVNELKHGNDQSLAYFFGRLRHDMFNFGDSPDWGRYREFALSSDTSDEHFDVVKNIFNALDEYTVDGDLRNLRYAIGVLPMFFPIDKSSKFKEGSQTHKLEFVKPIVQRYIKFVLNSSDFSDSDFFSETMIPINIWIATYFPSIEGHQSSIENRLNSLLEIQESADNRTLNNLLRTLQLIEQLPESMWSKTQVARLANKLFAYRVQSEEMSPLGELQRILKLLEMDENRTPEIYSALYKIRRDLVPNKLIESGFVSSIEFFKLVDGEYVFRAAGQDEPATADDDANKVEK